MRVFFCKYNDPNYLKMQKLEIMVRIANDKNVDQLLAELKEYALEVDMDFVRRAVKAIGQVAIKIESASEKCVNTLLDLINTKVNYVVQEAVVVIKDIFRKYPGYEGIIPTLCQCIDELDEPNARASLIWIVGEYAEKINNAGEILSNFVDAFAEEFTQVSSGSTCHQVQGLTSSRHNSRFSRRLLSSSSRSQIRLRDLYRKFFKLRQLRTITLTSEIELMCIGDCFRAIRKLQKTLYCLINHQLPRQSARFPLNCLTVS
jgi:hypothetical protein